MSQFQLVLSILFFTLITACSQPIERTDIKSTYLGHYDERKNSIKTNTMRSEQVKQQDSKNSQVLQNPEWSPIYGRSSRIIDGIDGLWRVVNYKKFYSKWPDIIGRLEKEWNHYRALNPRNVEEGKFFNMRTGIRGSLLMSFGGHFSGYSSCNSARVRNELLNGKWGGGQLSTEYAPKFKKHILDDRSFYIKVAEALEEVERLQAEAWAKAIKNK